MSGDVLEFPPLVNLCIGVTQYDFDFGCLMVKDMPDLGLSGQVFPLYSYERLDEGTLFDMVGDGEIVEGNKYRYVRHHNVLDETVEKYRTEYDCDAITKDDIFFYSYGLMHHPEYRTKYKNDLKKAIPRLPFAPDFYAFRDAGYHLGWLHVCYDQLDGWDLDLLWNDDWQPDEDWCWKLGYQKQRLVRDEDSLEWILIVNGMFGLAGIPDYALGYKFHGYSAVHWLVKNYYIKVDREHGSGIVNDANCLFDDPRDYVQLVRQIVEMSVLSRQIIERLPAEFEPELEV